ncbi:hypothetical protein Nepgr_028345 [Nepenthes gracilis]|uniref:Uncharacterized protein n=1 Tax=Nepenthes gracilis TaxID=150966 RepID=A0AAD3Y212_NEPGR|nr:hypothetical protein Nepgr_028345 [Nepenthes gracilis]
MVVLDVDAEFSGQACILLLWMLMVGWGCQGRYICSSILIGIAGSRCMRAVALELWLLIDSEFAVKSSFWHCVVCGCVRAILYGVLLLMLTRLNGDEAAFSSQQCVLVPTIPPEYQDGHPSIGLEEVRLHDGFAPQSRSSPAPATNRPQVGSECSNVEVLARGIHVP